MLQKFKELDIPHGGFYAEGAGADGKHLAELHRVSTLPAQNGIHTFSWGIRLCRRNAPKHFCRIPAIRKICPSAKRRSIQGTCNISVTSTSRIPGPWSYCRHSGKTGLMPASAELWWTSGTRFPNEAVFSDGRNGKEMHNGYALDYARGYRKLFESAYGEDHVLFQRAGAPGCQSYACQFGGDQPTTFPGMRQSLSGVLSVSASGLPFWGVDACGYDGFSAAMRNLYTLDAIFAPDAATTARSRKSPGSIPNRSQNCINSTPGCANLLPYAYSTAVQARITAQHSMVRPLPCSPRTPLLRR